MGEPLEGKKEFEMSTEAEQQRKRPYEKPKLRVIDLAAEEVLGIACKTATTGASGTSCASGSCAELGS